MSLEDPTMGATFDAWTSASEHGVADKMPAQGVEGETPEEGEWPARDNVPFVTMDEFHEKTGHRFAVPIGLRPAEVTEEMEWAAELACERLGFGFVPELAAPIYRAMHAAASVPLVSDAEIALTKERDAYAEQHRRAIAEVVYLASEVVALRAELMAAHDNLAKFTVQNAAEPDAPDPIANAIRPRETDRRRIGG